MTLSAPRPTSIRIFLADGRPDGLRIVEKSNWTGRAVVASRSQVTRAFERPELSLPGVYVLTGVTEEGAPRLYVGEADVLRERLRHHVSGRDFWTRFVVFSSTNEGLNKAHIRYLESRLIALAKAANQWELDNAPEPDTPPLSEADRADAEWFLEEMRLIFPLLGIDAFEDAGGQARASTAGEEDVVLYLKVRGAEGSGREVGDGFVVMKNSRARREEVPSIHDWLSDQRRQLRERGVLAEAGEALIFTQDFRFSSASTAAGILVGGSANGRLAWKDDQGRTLKQLQTQRSREAI